MSVPFKNVNLIHILFTQGYKYSFLIVLNKSSFFTACFKYLAFAHSFTHIKNNTSILNEHRTINYTTISYLWHFNNILISNIKCCKCLQFTSLTFLYNLNYVM